MQFAIFCCNAACGIVCYLLLQCHMPYSCYLFPYAVQFAICCRMLYCLLFVATHRTICYLLPLAEQFSFVAAHCTACYLLSHGVQLRFVASCCTVCSLSSHTGQFTFIATCCIACLCCHMPYSLLSIDACCTVFYLLLHALWLATCCSMLHS